MAGSWHGERAGPANGIIVGVDFRIGLGVLPVGLYERLGGDGDGAPGPIGAGKELRLETLVQAEGRARNRNAHAFCQRGALRIEDRRELWNCSVMPSSGVTGCHGVPT